MSNVRLIILQCMFDERSYSNIHGYIIYKMTLYGKIYFIYSHWWFSCIKVWISLLNSFFFLTLLTVVFSEKCVLMKYSLCLLHLIQSLPLFFALICSLIKLHNPLAPYIFVSPQLFYCCHFHRCFTSNYHFLIFHFC